MLVVPVVAQKKNDKCDENADPREKTRPAAKGDAVHPDGGGCPRSSRDQRQGERPAKIQGGCVIPRSVFSLVAEE